MNARDRFVASAIAQRGTRYELGAAGPDAFDCSGLVAYSYEQATGQQISRDSHAQFSLGRIVRGALQPGDLLFFDTGFSQRLGNRASHVGIAIGNGRMVHAFNEDYGVVESSLDSDYWRSRRLSARRLFTDGDSNAASPAGQQPAESGTSGSKPGSSPGPSTRPESDRERRKHREDRRRSRSGGRGRR